MPTVPRRTDRQVTEQAVPRVRLNPTAPVGAFGGGAAADQAFETGRALVRVGQQRLDDQERKRQQAEKEFQGFMAEQKREADELAVLAADVELGKAQTRLEVEAKNMRGRSAFGAPDFVAKNWAKENELIRKGLANDEQRAIFEQAFLRRSESIDRSLQVHVANERTRFDQEQTDEAIALNRDDASLNYTDPDRVDVAFRNIEGHVLAWAKRNGLKASDPSVQQKLREERSSAHVGILTRMMVDGQEDLAKAYEREVKGEILTQDLGIVSKVRAEERARRAEIKDQIERDTYIRYMDGKLSLPELRGLLRSGQIDRPFFELMQTRVTNINDDPTIAVDKKVGRFTELIDDFLELRGAEIDESGKLIAPARKNDIETLTAFRRKVAESAPFLTETQERAFYQFTQKNFDEARQPKVGIFKAFLRHIRQIPSLEPFHILRGASLMMNVFDTQVTVQQAQQTSERVATEIVVASNPNRSQYAIDQILTLPQGTFKVVGYDVDGEPLLEELAP